MPNSHGSNGAKAFGGIMAVVALLGGMAAIMRPFNDRLSTVEVNLHSHTEKLDHPVAVAGIAKQLRNDLDGHLDRGGHPALSERVKALEANGVALRHQDRMIRLLWQKVYSEPLPAINGGNH